MLPLRVVRLTVLAAAVAFLVACHKRDPIFESIVEQRYDLPPGQELSIRNAEGSVRIYGSNLPGIKLKALKKAYSSERLNKIEVKVAADGAVTVIDTIFPPKKEGLGFGDRSGTVDYAIVIPESTRIKNLEVVNGEISIEGLRGGSVKARLGNGRMFSNNSFSDLDFAVTNGRFDSFCGWWESRPFAVNGAMVKGNVNFYIPRGSSFRVDAETMDGRVIDHFGDPNALREDGNKLKRTVGTEPSPGFRIRVAHGNIDFEEAH